MKPQASLDIWLIDLERDGPAFVRLAEERGILSPSERQRRAAYRSKADATAFTASRAALDQILLERGGGMGATALRIAPGGKPFIPGGPAFSLSHTRSHAVVAINPIGKVGADIEAVRAVAFEEPLMERVARLSRHLWSPERLSIAAWTVVEAWAKLQSLTLAELLDSHSRQQELLSALNHGWSGVLLKPLNLPAGLVGACWFTGPAASVTLRELRPVGVKDRNAKFPASASGAPLAHAYPNACA